MHQLTRTIQVTEATRTTIQQRTQLTTHLIITRITESAYNMNWNTQDFAGCTTNFVSNISDIAIFAREEKWSYSHYNPTAYAACYPYLIITRITESAYKMN